MVRVLVVAALLGVGLTAIERTPVAFAQNYNPCSHPVQAYWCDSAPATSDIQLLSATLTPIPMKKGQPVYLNVTSVDTKTFSITKATYHLVLKLGFITVANQTGDGCAMVAQLAGQGQGCPIQPYSQQSGSLSFQIPSTAPSGTYSGSLTLTDQNGKSIQAIQFHLPVS